MFSDFRVFSRLNKRHLLRLKRQQIKRLTKSFDPVKEGKKMKFLRQTLLMAFLGLGLALTVTAQEQPDQKKKPPKNNAEIKPEDKKPPKNNENRDDKRNNDRKKPQTYFLLGENRILISST